MKELTVDSLEELLDYNAGTGVFIWKVKPAGNVRIGDVAGCNDGSGYIRIRVLTGRYRAHRLAWLYVYGCWPDGDIDHINGKRSDNRISNLRCVTGSENQRNQRICKTNTSGVLGVSWDRFSNKWLAQIMVDYKTINLGRHRSKKSAEKARKLADIKYGFHENHGN